MNTQQIVQLPIYVLNKCFFAATTGRVNERMAYVHVMFLYIQHLHETPSTGRLTEIITLKEKSRFSVVKLFIQTEYYKNNIPQLLLPGTCSIYR